jgi:uncharacterized protein
MSLVSRLFTDTFSEAERDLREQNSTGKFDKETAVILIWSAIALAMVRYYGDPVFVSGVLRDRGFDSWAKSLSLWQAESRLNNLCWWVCTILFSYLFVPLLIVRLLFRKKISDYGFRLKGAFKDGWLYLVMLAIMLPLVVFFSKTASFQARYPFYKPGIDEPLWPNFWTWELLYFAQFIAVEFFFRGFMTLGLRKKFGYYSIFIMTIPYCMIHFGKPMPETIGAIIAGIILGTLSMKSRSVFMGVFIHYSIAISMDLFAMIRR